MVVLGCALGACRDFAPPSDTVTLPIADRPWAEGAPPEGWCGEASLQMAALHFGVWVPQAEANRLGAPKTPDLWEHDLPTALTALGFDFERGPTKHLDALSGWTVKQLRAGHPVILGLKFVETRHPAWDVDHLVLVTGFTPDGLRLATNQHEGEVRAGWKALASPEGVRGYTLRNASGTTWAFAVKGSRHGGGVRAEVLGESAQMVRLKLTPERAATLLRDDLPLDAGTVELEVPATRVTRFGLR
jgi:hypothetical protein